MPKRLVRLRDRNFRYVGSLPLSQQPGPGIKWSSCNSTMNGSSGKGGGGGGGDKPVFQTATGVTMLGWKYAQVGQGFIETGLIFGATIIGLPLVYPYFVLGAGYVAYGNAQTAKFTRPCSDNQDTQGVTF